MAVFCLKWHRRIKPGALFQRQKKKWPHDKRAATEIFVPFVRD
jgi:hypothetical protein